MGGTSISGEEVAKTKELYLRGFNGATIARKLKRSQSTISRIIQRLGLEPHPYSRMKTSALSEDPPYPYQNTPTYQDILSNQSPSQNSVPGNEAQNLVITIKTILGLNLSSSAKIDIIETLVGGNHGKSGELQGTTL